MNEHTQRKRMGGAAILTGGIAIGVGAVALVVGSGYLGNAMEFKDGVLHLGVALAGMAATAFGWEQVRGGMTMLDDG